MKKNWTKLKDEELLKLRICDLGLSLEESPLEEKVKTLYQELEAKNLKFKPKLYLGDEWFSPEGVVAISIPFYLSHPRLIALEQRLMYEVEGIQPDYFLKLLRHEAGHCFDHAYRFSKKKAWRKLFGSPDVEYAPETYRPKPFSKNYVQNLKNWYSQAHPDEDFAETFAVWLSPHSQWKETYKKWPGALKKLEFIEKLCKEASEKKIPPVKGPLPYSASRMKMTLEHYYQKRKKIQAADYPDFYDADLKRIFNGPEVLSKKEYGAARFLKKRKKQIIDSVSYWTHEKKFTINQLFKKFIERCESLDLKLGKNQAETNLEIAAYLASLVTHYLFTGKFKRSL